MDYLVGVPLLLLVVLVQAAVVAAFVFGALTAVDAYVVEVPAVTLGLLAAAGLERTTTGAMLLYALAVGLAASVGLLVSTGGDWEYDADASTDGRWRP